MTRIRMTGWIAATALLSMIPALAETFHSQDGVMFEGTLRKVVPQAAACNVLEENHTPDEYERLKPNHGRGVDLWQVDFAVRNESGRQIEHLRASGWVRAEHPPCTNWSGEGPGGGPLLPQPSLLVPVVWSDYYQMLQRADGMRPGEQESRSIYLVVFGEHQPRFGEWDIDYRFAEGGGGTPRSGEGPQAPAPAFALPPEIQADRYLRQADHAVRSGDGKSARAAMERLEAMQQEHGLEPSPEDHYRYAEAWEAAGEPERAMAAAARYLQLEGREAEHYTAALDLMNRAEFGKAGPAARPAQGGAPAADSRNIYVCGIPPEEALAVTQQGKRTGQWRAHGPAERVLLYFFETEMHALSEVAHSLDRRRGEVYLKDEYQMPTFACVSSYEGESVRVWRLHYKQEARYSNPRRNMP